MNDGRRNPLTPAGGAGAAGDVSGSRWSEFRSEGSAGVMRASVPGRHRAEDVFGAVCGERTDCFWLDGGSTGPSFIGRGGRWSPAGGDAFGHLDDELGNPLPSVGFPTGLIGWLAYDLTGETLKLPELVEPERKSAFLRVTKGVRVDPDGRCWLIARVGDDEDSLREWMSRTTALLERFAVRSKLAGGAFPEVTHQPDDDSYAAAVRQCQEWIRDGDAYVLNLSSEFVLHGSFNPVDIYMRLRERTAAVHSALIRIGKTALVSASPETFLTVSRDRLLRTRPVKGTRRRSPDAVADVAIADALRADVKERAENVMIVDLMRNDLSRVCETASVSVPELFTVETLTHIHQLVSTVQGQLRDDATIEDVLTACFPAGSMTGAPKRSAVQLLHRLEKRHRGLYAGAFGVLGDDGTVELAMTIRSIVIEQTTARIGVGGGITALSDPAAEVAEMHLKAEPLLHVVGATVQRSRPMATPGRDDPARRHP